MAEIDKLFTSHQELISELEVPQFQRFLFKGIAWKSRTLAILSARGTGKTTMLWQYYQQRFSSR